MPATALVATVLRPACAAAAAAPPEAAAPPPLAAAEVPRWASSVFLSRSSGPTGNSAASALLVWRSCLRNVAQRSQVRRWRRTGALVRVSPSATSPSSLADLLARQQPRLGGLGERHAGPHEQRLDRRDGRLHRLGDLLVGQRVDLPQQQRGALRLRELLHVGDQEPELLAPVDLVGGRLAVLGEVDVHRVDADGLRAAQVVERPVACDPVQPRAHVDRAVVGEDRVEGGGEHLLQHVLRVLLRGQHVAAEGQQPRLIAGDQRLERVVVAAPHERDQAVVRLQAQQRRAPVHAGYAGWVVKCGSFHDKGFPPARTPRQRESCVCSRVASAVVVRLQRRIQRGATSSMQTTSLLNIADQIVPYDACVAPGWRNWSDGIALKAMVLRDVWVRVPPRALRLFWQSGTELGLPTVGRTDRAQPAEFNRARG